MIGFSNWDSVLCEVLAEGKEDMASATEDFNSRHSRGKYKKYEISQCPSLSS